MPLTFQAMASGKSAEAAVSDTWDAEQDYKLARDIFTAMFKRFGRDTLLVWLFEEAFEKGRQQATDMDAVRRG